MRGHPTGAAPLRQSFSRALLGSDRLRGGHCLLLRADVREQDAAILEILLGQAVAGRGGLRHHGGRHAHLADRRRRNDLDRCVAAADHVVRAFPTVLPPTIMVMVAIIVAVMVMVAIIVMIMVAVVVAVVVARRAEGAAGAGMAGNHFPRL